MSHILVKGAVPEDPQLQPVLAPRLEVYEFVKDTKFFSLYIKALQGLYTVPEKEEKSHFQLGGIHGLPYERWNGAGPEHGVTKDSKGYCHHKTHLFPTWHRPYCALYEAMVFAHAIDAAKKYTVDREEWIKAAIRFRLPFWDWGLQAFPPKEFYDVDNAAKVEIVDYDGTTTSVQNPLLSYPFAAKHGPPDPKHNAYLDTIAKFPSTLRHPTQPYDESSKSNVEGLETSLRALGPITRDNVRNLLLEVNEWYPFSTARKPPPGADGATTNSLEAIHDSLHINIGGDYGHMHAIPYAAFDPLFWLHHANVDRVLALWQVIHYDSWIEPAEDGNDTWVTKPRDLLDKDSQLAPFWKTEEYWWTSDQAKESAALWYMYPDFDGIDPGNRPEASQIIRARVKQLYGQRKVPGMPGENSKAIEWSARIRAVKGDLKDISSVLIFVGERPDNEKDFLTSPNYLGSFDPFVNALTALCSNCADTQDESVQGFVHMGSGLVERDVDVHDIGAVEVYLRKNLNWAVRKVGGGIVDDADIPASLEVTVIDTQVTPPTDGHKGPMVSGPREHPGITEGRPGGHRGE